MKSLTFFRWCLALALCLPPRALAQEDKAKALEAAAVAYAKAGMSGDVATVLKYLPKAQVAKFEYEFLGRTRTDQKVAPANPKVVSVDAEKNQVALQITEEQKVTLQLVQEDGAWKVDLAGMRGDPKVAMVEGRVRPDIENIKTMLQIYETLNGAYPSTKQGLAAMVAMPEGDPTPRRWRQLMPEMPSDPWGHPYYYEFGGKRSKDPYEVFSAGPDGKPNTNDDIGNW